MPSTLSKLQSLPATTPHRKVRLIALAVSITIASINFIQTTTQATHLLPLQATFSALIIAYGTLYYTAFKYSVYPLSALTLLGAAHYYQVSALLAFFVLACTFLLILTGTLQNILLLAIAHIAGDIITTHTLQRPLTIVPLLITLLLFIGLPLALRVVYEQKQATARAYTDYQTQVQETNLALARELHDTVARHISLINLTTGQALTHPNPSATQAALHTIDTSARQALADLRLLIQTTRTGPTNTDLPSQPASETDLAHSLATATESLRNQGFTLTTDIRIQPSDIPTGLHPTLHKIIQEISFNASKYATPGSTITLTAKPNLTGITITTSNPTTSTPTNHKKPGTGYGLVGITERVTRLGGTIRYGTSKGTWNLTIHLPIIRA